MTSPTRPAILKAAASLGLLILLGCQRQPSDLPLGNTHADSVAFMERHAEADDTSAIVWLAESDELDDGVVADSGKTLSRLRLAARKGCVRAMLLLGDAVWGDSKSAYGFAEDGYVSARGWYRTAAAVGYAPAIGRLGRLYLYETDIPADSDSAVYYLTLAADKGHARSYYWLACLSDRDEPEAVSSRISDSQALDFYRKASELGDGPASTALGRCYRNATHGLERSPSSALALFRRAAQQGDAEGRFEIAVMTYLGEGVPKDEIKAVAEFEKAAILGNGEAQYLLSLCFSDGTGVEQNAMLAYAWANLSCAEEGLSASAQEARSKTRETFARALSNEDRARAEKLASDWKKGQRLYNPESTDAPDTEHDPEPTASGTAFALNADGFALTNHHVIEDAKTIRVEGHEGVATVVAKDKANDLAVLKLPFRPRGSARFVSDPSRISLGEDVVVYGYPLKSLLSSGGNATTGTLSALTGLGNNASNIQITAAIQPGSSGSPVFDRAGHVIGIVVSKLDDAAMVRVTGNIGQTVNFAVNYATISAFLDASRVKYERAWPWPRLNRSTSDIVRDAREWTYQLEISY